MARTDLEPVAYRVALNIQTTLAAITAGDDYYLTPAEVVLLAGNLWRPNQWPSYAVDAMPMPLDDTGKSLNASAITSGCRFMVAAMLDQSSNQVRDMYRVAADIHHAIMVDRTRGGVATTTIIDEWDVSYPEDDESKLIVGQLVRVLFRTEEDDLTTAV